MKSYNSLKRLTEVSGPYSSGVSITYHYPVTGNNGKIDYQYDNVSGEQVNYTYDTVNRLITAATTSADWGQSFAYDGFTNLTGVTVTKGTAPGLTSSGGSNDSNGNPTSIYLPADGSSYAASYDVENRLVATGSSQLFYSYAPDNKRVWRGTWTGGAGSWARGTDTITFYSVNGQKLGDYAVTTTSGIYMTVPQFYATETEVNYYFGSRLIKNGNGWVYSDRLKSIGKFFPYGGEISPTTNGTEKFTGYFRDSETGLDYADQRYYTQSSGRFLTPDRGIGGVKPTDPGSWNKYAYTRGDPVNRVDRHGTDDSGDDGGDDGGDDFWDNGGGGGGVSACFAFAGLFSAAGLGMDACEAAIGMCSAGGDVSSAFDSMISPSMEAILCGIAGDGPTAGPGPDPDPEPDPDPAPAPAPCPANIRNFLVTMIPYANQLASTWSTNANDVLAVSALESGWLGQHAQDIKNPYGLTNKGGNDLQFSSYQAATNFWSSNDGSYIKGQTNITGFATALQPHYNTVDPKGWVSTIVKVLRIPRHENHRSELKKIMVPGWVRFCIPSE